MRRTAALFSKILKPKRPTDQSLTSHWPLIIRIENATAYRQYPNLQSQHRHALTNQPFFQHLSFSLPAATQAPQSWAIIGPSSSGKTTFLKLLRGEYFCSPPESRTYPFLATDEVAEKDPRLRSPRHAIRYVGFSGEKGGLGGHGTRGAYLSARYESRREETDFLLLEYLKGTTGLNSTAHAVRTEADDEFLATVVQKFQLTDLTGMPVGNLSNGQTRRAHIAKSVLQRPEVLLLDEPLMGLDPPTLITLSRILEDLANAASPRILMTLRPQDPIPHWITHVMLLGPNSQILEQGAASKILRRIKGTPRRHAAGRGGTITRTGIHNQAQKICSVGRVASQDAPVNFMDQPNAANGSLVKMEGVNIKYGSRCVLGGWEQAVDGQNRRGLHWNVRRGDRWGIFGPNGSGKTTLISLICSDHPQTYSHPGLFLFGHPRLPQPGHVGISIFDIQSRIGQSSPEIHAFFPRTLSVRQVLENAWADTFLGRPQLSLEQDQRVSASLRWFQDDLHPGRPRSNSDSNRDLTTSKNEEKQDHKMVLEDVEAFYSGDVDWADDLEFGSLPFSAQRVALFLRATIKNPDLVILDEAFSGMDDRLRDKCMLFLECGERYEIGDYVPSRSRAYTVKSKLAKQGRVTLEGLNSEQALICVSHIQSEVPDSVRQWMCLPEPNTGEAPRWGVLSGPMQNDAKSWKNIWGM